MAIVQFNKCEASVILKSERRHFIYFFLYGQTNQTGTLQQICVPDSHRTDIGQLPCGEHRTLQQQFNKRDIQYMQAGQPPSDKMGCPVPVQKLPDTLAIILQQGVPVPAPGCASKVPAWSLFKMDIFLEEKGTNAIQVHSGEQTMTGQHAFYLPDPKTKSDGTRSLFSSALTMTGAVL